MAQTVFKPRRVAIAIASVLAGFAATSTMAQEVLVGKWGSRANAVSADGSVVVGSENYQAVRWTSDGELEKLSDIQSFAYAVSADGTVVVGSISDDSKLAFRWTEADGIVELDLLPGGSSAEALGVSDDGSVVVGISFDADNLATAFRWTEAGGVESLGILAGGNRSTAYGVSGDGTVIVGDSSSATSGPWLEAIRWTEAEGMVELGKLNNSDASQARAASLDGSVIVGWATDGANGKQTAIRWTEESGMESLGMLDGDSLASLAYDVSSDGQVIVGSAADGSNVMRAFRWTEDSGMQTVEDWLRDAGAEIATDITWHAYGVNEDGTIIVGDTWGNQMFIARVSKSGGDDDTDNGDDIDSGDDADTGSDMDTGDDAVTDTDIDTGDDVDTDNVNGSGGGPAPGLITVNELVASLSTAGAVNSSISNNLGTVMNGAGSRPLDRRVSQGRSTFWVGGDWGKDNHRARDGEMELGELGIGRNFSGLQLNGVFGLTSLEQHTTLDGRTDMDAKYIKLEALAPLRADETGGLWLAITGTRLWGHADMQRNYITNGGVIDGSSGRAGVKGYGVRARAEWENLFRGLSPYGEFSFARACLGSYTEVGGAFPALFNRLCDNATEARLGVDTTFPVTERLSLIAIVEGVNRFENRGSNVTGQVIGLGAFSLPQASYDQSWLRGGLGFNYDIGGSILSVMANATTKGESSNAWLAANWRVAF